MPIIEDIRLLSNGLLVAVAASSLAWEDPPADVGVFPFEGARGFRIGSDIAHEFARQILNRGEDTPSNDFALQPGKPDLDLIEPGRIGRRKVKLHMGIPVEKVRHLMSLV